MDVTPEETRNLVKVEKKEKRRRPEEANTSKGPRLSKRPRGDAPEEMEEVVEPEMVSVLLASFLLKC